MRRTTVKGHKRTLPSGKVVDVRHHHRRLKDRKPLQNGNVRKLLEDETIYEAHFFRVPALMKGLEEFYYNYGFVPEDISSIYVDEDGDYIIVEVYGEEYFITWDSEYAYKYGWWIIDFDKWDKYLTKEDIDYINAYGFYDKGEIWDVLEYPFHERVVKDNFDIIKDVNIDYINEWGKPEDGEVQIFINKIEGK